MLRLEYAYDDRNLVTRIEEYEEEEEVLVADVDFTYDDRGRLTHETRHHGQDPTRSYNLEYQYDEAGNRTKKIDQINLFNTLETTYIYDYENSDWESDYNQLMWSETCERSGGMQTLMVGDPPCIAVSKTYYYYNDDGNVINVVSEKLSPGPGEKQYSATWLRYGANEQTVTFAVGDEWDVDGNGDPIPESYNILWAREYRYDQARARYLDRVLDPDELEDENFVGDDTWSQYDGDEIYSDYTIDGQDVTVTTWYEPGIGKVNDVDGTPTTTYYHDDLIGTTRFMTDVDGNKVEGAVYTAFGELVSGDPRRFGYAGAWGYQTDVSPGSAPPTSDMPFLHVGHRYYDPSIGRFLQRDPIGTRGGLNVYNYVGAKPTIAVDPLGAGPAEGVKQLGEGHFYRLGCSIWWWSADSDCCLELKPRDQWPKPPRDRKPRTLKDDWRRTKNWWRRNAGGLGGPPRHRISCFVGGTTVLGTRGLVFLEELELGEELACWDVEAGSTTICEVTKVHVGHSIDLVHVSLKGETITCTPEHPFWVDGRGWVKAAELTTTDHLMNVAAERILILGLERESLVKPIPVYNISVGAQRTFYVGKNRILVHNKLH